MFSITIDEFLNLVEKRKVVTHYYLDIYASVTHSEGNSILRSAEKESWALRL